MSVESLIEWTNATWNFLLGCSMVSSGCANCYAIRTCWRLQHNPNPKIAAAYAGLVKKLPSGKLVWTGKVNFVAERLTLPLRWTKPKLIFVNSESDLFHESVSFEIIDKAFAVMALANRHTFQILTKRADRMREYVTGLAHGYERLEKAAREIGYTLKFEGIPLLPWPIPNIWLGVSVENQDAANERVLDLLKTPAAIRFLSCEPLLGPVSLNGVQSEKEGLAFSALERGAVVPETLDWVIAGGESGPEARPMSPDWVRKLRVDCHDAGVPFFFKQWGEWMPADSEHEHLFEKASGAHTYVQSEPDGRNHYMLRVGKKNAGRMQDFREWNEMPGQTRGQKENAERRTPNAEHRMAEG